jgi:hypothetical protein
MLIFAEEGKPQNPKKNSHRYATTIDVTGEKGGN